MTAEDVVWRLGPYTSKGRESAFLDRGRKAEGWGAPERRG